MRERRGCEELYPTLTCLGRGGWGREALLCTIRGRCPITTTSEAEGTTDHAFATVTPSLSHVARGQLERREEMGQWGWGEVGALPVSLTCRGNGGGS